MMCASCRQVISDSNQLVAAVARLDALVLDAVVGVRIGQTELHDADALFAYLSCNGCNAELGRAYRKANPEIHQVVSETDAPRYTLHRSALSSYVLGSTKAQHDAAHPLKDTSKEAHTHVASPATGQNADEVSPTTDKLLVQQLMRVVLGLDHRLRRVEQSMAAASEETQPNTGQKRPR